MGGLNAGHLRLPPTPITELVCPQQNHCWNIALKQKSPLECFVFQNKTLRFNYFYFCQSLAAFVLKEICPEKCHWYVINGTSKRLAALPLPPAGSPAFPLPSHQSHPLELLKFSTFTPWETPDALKESWLRSCKSNKFSVWQKIVMSYWGSSQSKFCHFSLRGKFSFFPFSFFF